MREWSIPNIVLCVVVSLMILLLGFSHGNNNQPTELYQVYLDGEIIGTIESEEDFVKVINEEQQEIKDKYNVDTVYNPLGIETKKVYTYDTKIDSSEQVYKKITEERPFFTIKGYVLTIKKEEEEDKHIYALNKEIIDSAIDRTVRAFVNSMDYDNYLNDTQEPINIEGSLIEDVDWEEELTIKEDLIPTNERIFTNDDELAKYLLFGTEEEIGTYVVGANEDIEDVAFKHNLSTQEFLIANSDMKSENVMLYENKVVNVGLIDPLINIVTIVHKVERLPKEYKTEIQYDSNQPIGYEEIVREGEDGLYEVTQKIKYVNGQMNEALTVASTELKPAVNKIVIKGDKYIPNVADDSYWAWPTRTPYVITTGYEYRWGEFHPAIDIAAIGHGSPIYAVNNGTIHKVGWGHWSMGNYIIIRHNNAKNYYTIYMHMSNLYVKQGQTVARGQVIGAAGSTGVSTGTHLHFGLYVGEPYNGGYSLNPWTIFRWE